MEKLIEVHEVSKIYKKRKTKDLITAVDTISFDVYRGEILGLLGSNGAGKTSTIKMMCGLLQPDKGVITINGIDIWRKRSVALHHISAVLEGNRSLYWRLTVQENMEYFSGNRGVSRKVFMPQIEKLLSQFGLKDKKNELVNGLSRGMQQKLSIAIALLANTDLVVLDEPTLGLDVEASHSIRQLLKQIAHEEQRTIIISSHDMPVIQELCDRTIIINNGKVVVDDRVDNLLKLFETRAYTLKLGENLTPGQTAALSKEFPLHTYTPDENNPIIAVNLERSEDIYELMTILKTQDTPIESIDRTMIDFEQVFLQIVKGGEVHDKVI